MKIISVNIGTKKTVSWKGKMYTTGIFKDPVKDVIFLGKEDVVNDDVIDRKYHGGVDQAVYAYGENHYAYWKKLYPHLEFSYGMFGENLTVTNLWEDDFTVGSIYKLGIRFQDVQVIKQFWNTTKSGIYFKVLETGKVAINDEFILLEKAKNSPSIAEVYLSKKI